eukprot:tig00001292_g8050.t1
MPPKSKETKATADEDTILELVNQQNRPLSSQNIIDHLKLGKAAAERVIAKLAETGKISVKEFGKSKIYFARQDQFDAPDSASLARMDAEITSLTQKLAQVTEEVKELNAEMRKLGSALTQQEIAQRLVALRDETAKKRQRLTKLKDGGNTVTPEHKRAVEAAYAKARNAWRQRKRLCEEIVGQMCELSGMKLQQTMESMGLETDADAGVSLGNDLIDCSAGRGASKRQKT